MEWQPGQGSQDIEDRRGQGGGGGGGFNIGGGGIGIGVFLIVAVISLLTGRNFLPLLFQAGGGGGAPTARANGPVASSPAEERDKQLMGVVLDDAQQRWADIFQQNNLQYRKTRLVLFRDATYSGCGTAQAATGPFYCPQDEKIYIDLGFWNELRQMGGNTGDFAQSYVLTHELGHHIQKLLGVEAREQRLAQANPQAENALSVMLELQADCFAGVWGHNSAQRFKLNQDDLTQALQSAAAVGDDHIQKMSGRAVSPESWTHGSSQQRQQWFTQGFQNGQVKGCTTFNGKLAP